MGKGDVEDAVPCQPLHVGIDIALIGPEVKAALHAPKFADLLKELEEARKVGDDPRAIGDATAGLNERTLTAINAVYPELETGSAATLHSGNYALIGGVVVAVGTAPAGGVPMRRT